MSVAEKTLQKAEKAIEQLIKKALGSAGNNKASWFALRKLEFSGKIDKVTSASLSGVVEFDFMRKRRKFSGTITTDDIAGFLWKQICKAFPGIKNLPA